MTSTSWYRRSVWNYKGVREYTKAGYDYASAKFVAEDLDVDCTDRHYMITGCNSGIGFAIAVEVAKRGGVLHMVCRNKDAARAARSDIITTTGNDKIYLHVVDLGKPVELAYWAQKFAAKHEKLHVLVHNADVYHADRLFDDYGIESNFAVNVLTAYILNVTMLPVLQKNEDARVVTVGSAGMLIVRLDPHDIMHEKFEPFDAKLVYAQNKRQQAIMSLWFAQRWENVHFSVMNPGWADTTSVTNSLPVFDDSMKDNLRTATEAADTAVWLALSKAALTHPSGLFFQDREPVPTHLPLAWTKATIDEEELLMKHIGDIYATVESHLPGATQEAPAKEEEVKQEVEKEIVQEEVVATETVPVEASPSIKHEEEIKPAEDKLPAEPIAPEKHELPAEPEPVAPEKTELPVEPEPIAPKEHELPAEPEPIAPEKPKLPAEPKHIAPEKPKLPAEPEHIAPEKPELPAEPKHIAPEKPKLPAESKHIAPEKPKLPAEPEHIAPEEPKLPAEPEPIAPKEPKLPAEPEPIAPKKSKLHAEPTVLVKPKLPAELITHKKSELPAEPIAPEKHELPAEPIAHPKPKLPAEPIEPIVPTKPKIHAEPIEPIAPVKPKIHAEPIEPIAPAKPKIHAQPIEPIAPAKPKLDAEPIALSKPKLTAEHISTKPIVPAEPVSHAKPKMHTAPAEPAVVAKPKLPIDTTKPVDLEEEVVVAKVKFTAELISPGKAKKHEHKPVSPAEPYAAPVRAKPDDVDNHTPSSISHKLEKPKTTLQMEE